MEKRIELERRNRPVSQIDELNLDNCRSTTIEGLTDEFQNLKSLSLNGVGLTSLKGFPALQNLRKLEMGDNRIAGGLQVLKDCARLVWLNLSNNKIKDMDTIEPLKDLPALKSLDLYRNEITQLENYRGKVFQLLPGLTYLDGTDVNNKEADESDIDGLEEEEDGDGPPVNGKSDLDDGHDDTVGATEGDSNYESSISVVSPEEPDEDGDEDEEDEETDEVQAVEQVNLEVSHDEEDDGEEDDDDDDDEEEDEEEEESGNLESALTEIYREDLSDCSDDDGDYEEESEVEYVDEDEEEEDLEASNVIDEGEAEVPGEMELAPLQHHVDGEGSLDLEGDQHARRGVKRPREDLEEGD